MAVTIPMICGCATQTPRMGSLRLKTDDYNKLKERQEAQADVEEETARAPLELTAADHERLGDAQYLQGNVESAFVHYDKALRQNPESPSLYLKQGEIFLDKGRNREAIDAFQEVLRRKPGHAKALEALGMAQYRLGDLDAGEASLQEALRLDPNLWRAHAFLGVIRNHQRHPRLALVEFSAAIRLRPGEGFLYNNMGVSHGLLGDHEEAVAAFRKALACGAASRKIYNNLGLTLAKMGRYEEAWEAFALGGSEAEAHNNLGCVLLYRGEHEKARRSFEKALEASPTFYPRALKNLEWTRRALEKTVSLDRSIPIEAGQSSSLEDGDSEDPPREEAVSQTVAEKVTAGDAEKEPAGLAAAPPTQPDTGRDEPREKGKAAFSGSTRVDASVAVKDNSESAGTVAAMGENSLNQKEAKQEETPDPSDIVTAEAVSKPEFPAGQGIYTIQVATFVEKAAAAEYVAELKRQNLNAFQWEVYLPKQGARHRICVGNFNTLKEAQGIARDLQERGLSASVAKLPVGNIS